MVTPHPTPTWVARVLGRDEHPAAFLPDLSGRRVLVTGARGSIGVSLVPLLKLCGADVSATDVDNLDVTNRDQVRSVLDAVHPHLVFHLAGAKHAPEGEADPSQALRINAVGTENIVTATRGTHARIILASTGKAANPETAYGAAKLIAERMVLNAGGSVARFYNVIETQGNVFDIWREQPGTLEVVTECSRYFITLREALGLMLHAAGQPGRFAVDAKQARNMHSVASDLYPGRSLRPVPARRGDRIIEPRCAHHERVRPTSAPGVVEITSPHDNQNEAI